MTAFANISRGSRAPPSIARTTESVQALRNTVLIRRIRRCKLKLDTLNASELSFQWLVLTTVIATDNLNLPASLEFHPNSEICKAACSCPFVRVT